MTADVVIGIDIGTTSSKAVAFTPDGTARASGEAKRYELASPRPGFAEQDPDAVASATLAATAETVRAARAAGHRVAGLAFSTAMHTLMGLGPDGAPVTPLVTWADNRAADLAARLRTGARGLALHRRTGTPVHPMSPLLKLRWFADEEPDVAAGVRHWVGIKDYVMQRMTGELVVDHGVASTTGLFNLGDEDWDAEALTYAGVSREQLPELVPTTAALPLDDEGARLVGLAAGTPVVAGGGDGPLANLGLGAIRPGTVACSIGTSGAVRVVSDTPRVDERGRVFCYVLAPHRYVIGGAVNNGGIVLDWLADAIAPDVAAEAVAAGRSRAAALLEIAGRSPAGSRGLLFLPYLLGERAPHWSGHPSGVYLGLTREHRREDLLRAAVEGVCLQLSIVLGSLGEAGLEIREIRATGGLLAQRAVAQDPRLGLRPPGRVRRLAGGIEPGRRAARHDRARHPRLARSRRRARDGGRPRGSRSRRRRALRPAAAHLRRGVRGPRRHVRESRGAQSRFLGLNGQRR